MKNAIIYCRVSTEEQANKGISIDAQERTCSKLAREQGYQILDIIKDEGQSGGTLKRPGMQRILKLVEENQPDAIFALHSDRFSRNVKDHIYLKELFQTKKIKTVFAIGLNFDDSAMGQTMDTMTAAMNQMIRLIVSEKTKSALDEKAKEGWFPGIAPIGYINVDNPNFRNGELSKRIIKPDPERAPFIKLAFKLFSTGNYNAYELDDLMYKKGLRTKRGNKIVRSKFYEMLKNPVYAGELHWGDINLKKAKHEPLIDRILFEKVQSVLDGHNRHACRRRKHQFLLNGFAFCFNCGKRMIGEWHMKKSGLRFGYYHCPSTYGCKNPEYIKVDDLEGQVASQFKGLYFSDKFIDLVISEADQSLKNSKYNIENQKQTFNNRLNNLEKNRSVVEDKLVAGVLSDEAFGRIEKKIKDEMETIQEESKRLEVQRDVKVDEVREILKFTRDIYKTYSEGSPELKRRILNYFWDRFLIKDKKIIRAQANQLMQDLMELNALIKKAPIKEMETLTAQLPGVRISSTMGGLGDSNP
ncbi:MAG: recombinase family protein [bacterium]|nr:recombinase family protein [bacterium]